MKKKKMTVIEAQPVIVITVLLMSAATTVDSQYELNWSTIDGGGGLFNVSRRSFLR